MRAWMSAGTTCLACRHITDEADLLLARSCGGLKKPIETSWQLFVSDSRYSAVGE